MSEKTFPNGGGTKGSVCMLNHFKFYALIIRRNYIEATFGGIYFIFLLHLLLFFIDTIVVR